MIARVLLAVVAASVGVAASGCANSGEPPPIAATFSDDLVARIDVPTAIAFLPDGRMLVTSQTGILHLLDAAGHEQAEPALDLRSEVCTERERGLVGVAVDPLFERNGFIYVYYTQRRIGGCPVDQVGSPVNRLVRYVLRGGIAEPESATVLLDDIPSVGATHNAGGLGFGKDGLLYVGIGDGGRDYAHRTDASATNRAARDLNVLLGKIVRIDRDGRAPAANPYAGASAVSCARSGPAPAGAVCAEIFASGLRNPFKLAFDPDAPGVRFAIDDVGQEAWEEVDIGVAGADYGWNQREGPCPRDARVVCGPAPPRMMDPWYAYAHRWGCNSITGGAFVPRGVWPAAFDGGYLHADFGCGRIVLVRGRGSDVHASLLASVGNAGVVALAFGPPSDRGGLYYAGFISGEIRRLGPAPGAASGRRRPR
jgi:glucose/arabinose dehydrogenase